MITTESLIDRKQLIELYPALGAKKYRLDHLIRTRQIPIVKRNRSIFFNPKRIEEWILENEIKPVGK
jgi:hypothetical protein